MFTLALLLACTAADEPALDSVLRESHPSVDSADGEQDSSPPNETGDTRDTTHDEDAGGEDSAPVEPLDALQVVFVVDITGSWSRRNMHAMSTELVAALDALVDKSAERGAPGDSVALVAYYGRYAYTLTPWTELWDATAVSAARDTWGALEVASRGGTPREYPEECALAVDSPAGAESARNQFPTGGCYPHMPREYTDESGTDHTVGLALAEAQFMSMDQGSRALVLVTDGVASALASSNGSYRVAQGYTEARWEEHQGPVPHTTAEIDAETPALAQAMHDNLAVDTWALSYVAAPDWMGTFATGRGTTAQLGDAEEFEAALLGIVGEL